MSEAAVRRRKGAGALRRLLIPLLLAAGAALLTAPAFRNSLSEIRQSVEMLEGAVLSAAADPETLLEMEKEAEIYNRSIALMRHEKPFEYRGEDHGDAHYRSLLSWGKDGLMGYLEIGKLGIMLPIVHGTDGEALEFACGHMYGTSLPSGGDTAHCVLAGHTGLPSAELFTRLTEMGEGDRFSVHLPWRTHHYRTVTVRVVEPERERFYLQPEEGRDLVTLYTCTPYGINDRRLLVTGERSLPDSAPGESEADRERLNRRLNAARMKCICLGACPWAAALFAAFSGRRRKGGGRMREC